MLNNIIIMDNIYLFTLELESYYNKKIDFHGPKSTISRLIYE